MILFFYKHIYIKKQKIKLEIDNIFELPLYENNIVFSNYSTEIKPIALYYPDFIIFNQYFNNISKIENFSIEEFILKQVDLARNHGIFGFIINYVFNCNSNIYDNVLNAFHYNNKINFPFSLNWINYNFKSLNHINIELIKFLKFIKKYLISKNYIKIHNKPLISIGNPFIFHNLKEVLFLLRKEAKENEIGEIFIIFPYNESMTETRNLEFFDAVFDFSKFEPLEKDENKMKISCYCGFIYKNLILNDINNSKNSQIIYRTSILEIPSKSLKNNFKDYTIEK